MRKNLSVPSLEEEAKYVKFSFRQKGCELKGSIYKGGVVNAYAKKTIGSIPSKYETILCQNASTTKGFGSATYRFAEAGPDSPGPGTYLDPHKTSAASLKTQSDSYSKKGYGNGFLSQSDRFRIENYHLFQVPGPSSYQKVVADKSALKQNITERYKNKQSPAFASKGSGSFDFSKNPNNPGPGSYNLLRSLSESPDYRNVSPFKYKGDRFEKNLKATLPGPGQYELDLEGLKRKLTGNPLGVSAEIIATSNFKKPIYAKRVKVNLYDPFENVEIEEKKSPGPGYYNFPHGTMGEKLAEKLHVGPSSMFILPEVIDRFGKTALPVKEGPKPGPGHYFTQGSGEDEVEEVVKNPSPVFKSEAKRIEYLKVHHGPGPAFYRIGDKFPKDTKNFNPSKEWI